MQLQEKIEYIVEVFEMLKNPKCDVCTIKKMCKFYKSKFQSRKAR